MRKLSEEIDRWIKFMKENPTTWKKIHTAFINSQFSKSLSFIQRLSKTPGGKDKIISACGIKNKAGYPKLLGD